MSSEVRRVSLSGSPRESTALYLISSPWMVLITPVSRGCPEASEMLYPAPRSTAMTLFATGSGLIPHFLISTAWAERFEPHLAQIGEPLLTASYY